MLELYYVVYVNFDIYFCNSNLHKEHKIATLL